MSIEAINDEYLYLIKQSYLPPAKKAGANYLSNTCTHQQQ